MSYAAWKDLGLRAVGLISREPPPAQIFIWLFIAFLVLMVLEGFRANFLPTRLGRGRSNGPSTAQPAPSAQRQTSFDSGALESVSVRRPVPQLLNQKRVVASVRSIKAFRPGIRRDPHRLDWHDAFAPAMTEPPQSGVMLPGAPILFEPMEQEYKPH